MTAEIESLIIWYKEYAGSFKNGDLQLEDAVTLKYEHTMRVCNEMALLCNSLRLGSELSELAHIAALFHDVARFEQFKRYRTFSDKKSENHAEMAVALIVKNNLFASLSHEHQSTLLAAIRFHNAAEVPDTLSHEQAYLCRLLRDADKLDIYKITLDYYVNPDPTRHETVQVGIPDGTAVTPEVCEYVLMRKIVPYEKIKTVADFKMIQLGWVFDLNFIYSISCVKYRGYVDEIKKYLPMSALVSKAVRAVEQFLDEQVAKGASS